MASPNYNYEKRQRELAKKKKKEDKLRERDARKTSPDGEFGENPPMDLEQASSPDGDLPEAGVDKI
jgi:hypothetical protein